MLARIWGNWNIRALLMGILNSTAAMEDGTEKRNGMEKSKIELPCDLFQFSVYKRKNRKQGLKEVSVHPCSQQHYSQ